MTHNGNQNIFLRMNTGAHTSAMGGFEVTQDGSHIVSMGHDKTIRVWDPISQREVDQIRGRIGRGSDGALGTIALTPDDKYLLSAAQTPNNTKWDLRIYDFYQSKLLRSIGSWGSISAIQFSPDDRLLVLTDYYHKKAEIYDYREFSQTLNRSSLLHTINFPDGMPQRVIVFQTEDAYRIAVTLWDLVTNQHSMQIFQFDEVGSYVKQIKKIESFKSGPETIACNQAHIAFTYHSDKRITIVDYEGNLVTEFESAPHPYELKYSPDGKLLLAGYRGDEGECIVYDVDDEYKPLTHFFAHKSTASATAFLNSQTVVTGGGDDNEIYFWTPQTGEIRGHITGHGEAVFGIGRQNNLIGFGNNQEFRANANNLAPLERVIDLDNFDIFDIEDLFEPDFKRIQPVYKDQTLEVRDIDGNVNLWLNEIPLTGNLQVLDQNQGYTYGPWYFAESFGFTEDGLVLAGTHGDGRIYAIHVDESKGWAGPTYVACLRGHTGHVWDMVVLGNRLVSCGTDQIIRIWNLDEIPRPQSEEEIQEFKKLLPWNAHQVDPILQMFFTKDKEWIIWSKSGFYDASLNGDRFVGFHVNRGEEKEAEFYTSDRFSHTLFRPDVIREIIKVGSEEQVLEKFGLAGINIEDILPPTIIFAGDTSLAVDEGTIPLEFRVTHPQDQPLSKVWILINEIPVWEWNADDPGEYDPASDEILFKIDDLLLTPANNKIVVMARTKLSQSNRLDIEVYSRLDEVDELGRGSGPTSAKKVKRIRPNLYLLAVGVSNYKYGKGRVKGEKPLPGVLYNLNFAEKDAIAINQIFQSLKGESFAKVETTVLTDAEATNTNINKAVKALGKTIELRAREKRQNKQIARDVVVIFMAGHGVKIDGDFYFMSHEAKPGSVKTTSVKMLDIGEVINGYKAEIVMLTDACHSGQIGDNFNNRELTKSWKEINGRAQVIFSATTADRVSIEHPDWGHGAFTRGILDVINENKERWMLQFFPDVSNTVRAITNPRGAGKGKARRMQKPTLTILGVMSDFRLKRINRK